MVNKERTQRLNDPDAELFSDENPHVTDTKISTE